MKLFSLYLFVVLGSLTPQAQGQTAPKQGPPVGYFLNDSIEIGRPFRYSLTYHHAPAIDVLFPDTARSFAPYRVQKVAVFATQTTGDGSTAVSRDSAVYTLVSFETDSMQLLQVPLRTINSADCTEYWTRTDTVFLRSKLGQALSDSLPPRSFTLATETTLAPLQQQFNYGALLLGFMGLSLVLGVCYLLFGNLARRQWRLYVLNRRHVRFLREYTRLNEQISPLTAAEVANQAVVMWKQYLEQLDPQPYSSLTTSELSDRFHDEQVTNALREADQMIYGSTFTAQSQPALTVLSDVATRMYVRCRATLRSSGTPQPENAHSVPSSESSS